MAKKIAGYIKLQIPAGKATPAPPVGPALGQHGVNIMEFVKQFKRENRSASGIGDSCCHHGICRQIFLFHFEEPARCGSHQAGMQNRFRLQGSE